MANRTPRDYAIEHAEYMAQAAEKLLGLASFEQDSDYVIDARNTLRDRIYEFRKRAERASRESSGNQ